MGVVERACPVPSEQDYLTAATHQHDQELREETERAERERALERRSLVRLRALVAVLTVAALVAAGLTTVAVSRAASRIDCGTRPSSQY